MEPFAKSLPATGAPTVALQLLQVTGAGRSREVGPPGPPAASMQLPLLPQAPASATSEDEKSDSGTSMFSIVCGDW